MNVLHVVVNGHMGGGQRIVSYITDHLLKIGEKVCLLSPDSGTFTQAISAKGVPVFFKPMRKTYHLHDALAIAKLIKREKIDFLHTHSLGAGNVLSRLGGLFSGRPVISHVHGENNYNANPLIRRYQQFLDRATLSASQKIIAVSEKTKQNLVHEGIDPSKIEIILNGVEIPPQLSQARKSVFQEFSIPENAAVAACIGQLCQTKGQDLLIEACAILEQQNQTLVLLLVGEDLQHHGLYQKKLKELAQAHGIENRIRFIGLRQDVPRLIQASNFVVLPSRIEGLPLVILEAMASAKPVIATDVGGISEVVIHQKTGLLVNPGSKENLAKALRVLLENPRSAEQMGQAGQKLIEKKHQVSIMLEKVMKIYREILAQDGRHRN